MNPILNLLGGFAASIVRQILGEGIDIAKTWIKAKSERQQLELNLDIIKENNRNKENLSAADISNQQLLTATITAHEKQKIEYEHINSSSRDWFSDKALLFTLKNKSLWIQLPAMYIMSISYAIHHLTMPILAIILVCEIDTGSEALMILEVLLGYFLGNSNAGFKKKL